MARLKTRDFHAEIMDSSFPRKVHRSGNTSHQLSFLKGRAVHFLGSSSFTARISLAPYRHLSVRPPYY